MRAFRLAVQLLTRVPLPSVAMPTPPDHGRSVLYYPLVGLILGLVLVVMQQLLTTTDVLLQSVLLLLLWVLLTGGLHLDGLADSADAWAGSHGDRDAALRILSDPASGPAAVTVVVLVLLMKFAALTVVIQAGDLSALILAPVLGRTVIVGLFRTTPYVRNQGLGSAQAAHLPPRAAVGVLAVTGVIVLLGFGRAGVWALIATALVFWALRRMMLRRLGGTTGDTLGASCELTEAIVLVTLALTH